MLELWLHKFCYCEEGVTRLIISTVEHYSSSRCTIIGSLSNDDGYGYKNVT